MAVIKHYISLDESKFQSKPTNQEAGSITNRIASSESDIEVTIKELMEYLVQPNGQTWSPAIFSNNKKSNETWQSQGYIALDFDCEDPNHPDPKKAEKYTKEIADKKEFFGPNYEPGIKLEDVIQRCKKYGVMPCAAHTSFSADETNNRFRLIFQLYNTNTNPKIAKYILQALYLLFPESDSACSKSISYLFFGGIAEIYSEYDNVLDVLALFKGSLDYINDTYNPNAEKIKEYLNGSTLINGAKVLDTSEYGNLVDKSDVVETMDSDGKLSLVQFTFGERVKDQGDAEQSTHAYKREEKRIVMDDWDVKWVSDALNFCNAADREAWVNIGMGLKHSFGDTAKDLWMKWSQTVEPHDDDTELEKRWNGFKPNGSITVGSVREHARKGGWDPIPETVKKFNKKFFHYINDNGSEVVAEEIVTEEENRFGKIVKDIHIKENKRTAFINFREGVNPLKIKKNNQDEWVNRGKYWITHQKRRRVQKIVFKPKGNLLPGEYNLWSNFQSMKENVPNSQVDPSKFSLYWKHIIDVIANGNKDVAKYVIGWMAYAVQFPEKIPEVAVVMVGKQGTGKSLFVDMFGQIFGKHYICLQSEEALTGRFNSHLANKVLVFADEAVWKGDHKAVNKLKNNVTNSKLNLEGKGKDIIDYDNYMHIMMASNNRIVLKIDPDDRRFFIVDLSDKWYKRKDETPSDTLARKQYFDAMVKQFNEDGGMEHFYSFLKGYNLDGFNVRDYPNTDIKDEHKLKAMEPRLEGFMIDKLQSGLLYEYQDKWGVVKRSDFYDDYCRYIKMNPSGGWDLLPDNVFGREIRKLLPDCIKTTTGSVRVKDDGKYKYERANVYGFANLDDCRKVFEKTINIYIKWDTPVEDDMSVLPIDQDKSFDELEDTNEDIETNPWKDVWSSMFGNNKGETTRKIGDQTISF